MKFHHKTKTRWKDLDAFQHINNAVFLSYFEDARISLFDRWNLKPSGKSLIVASVKVNYYKQLLHPTDFLIGQKVSRVGNSSFDIQSSMFNQKDELISDALITCVCFDFTVLICVAVCLLLQCMFLLFVNSGCDLLLKFRFVYIVSICFAMKRYIDLLIYFLKPFGRILSPQTPQN